METQKILRNGITLMLVACLFLAGCKKEVEEIQPVPEETQSDVGLKATATGKIMSAVVNGTYRTDLRLNLTNTITLKVNVYTIGYYTLISNTANGIAFTKSGMFTFKGIQDVTLYGNGTPLITGVNSYSVSLGTGIAFNVVTVKNTPIVQSSCNNSYTYYEVANHKTLKVWLDRNLGASQVATSAIDFLSYGSLFQWGRLSDGHQCIVWTNANTGVGLNGTTSATSSSNTPGHSLFIKSSATPWDWRVPQNHSLWQGNSALNNPCPSGYRVPTATEMNTEATSWNSKNITGAYGSSLKWAVAGYREFYDATVYEAGSTGAYWTSTIANTTKATFLEISTSSALTVSDFRAEAYSVRCIKE
ncbi:MAG: hypothetical protein NTW16_07800 [Bacteroidetes bacterium]|nr:hypothetical protein [Bacteroidota bacterium]